MTDTLTTPETSLRDDGPLLHKSGAVQFHLDDTLVTLRPPKIGELRIMRDAHREATAKVREATADADTKRKELAAELDSIKERLEAAEGGSDDAAAEQLVTDSRARSAEVMNEILTLVADNKSAAYDIGTELATGWFALAMSTLSDTTPPDPDDMPAWMAQLGTVRQIVEHWMTHPSPRGI